MLDEKPAMTATADWLPTDESDPSSSLCEKMNEEATSRCNSFEQDVELFASKQHIQTDERSDAEMKKETDNLRDRDNGNVAKIEDFEILKLLGKGAYGKVYQVQTL